MLWIGTVSLMPIEGLTDARKGVFVFLGIFPLINAGFDFLSYTLTLALMRFGFRQSRPWLYAGIDVICAAILFFLLGVTLVAVITVLNYLAGPQAELFSLGTLLAELEHEHEKHLWVFAMIFSTLIPTVLHLFLAALSLTSVVSFLRRPALWLLQAAPESPVAALGASFMISVMVFATVAVACAPIWAAWHYAGDGIERYLGFYIKILLSIAQSIGSF
jgi:hypothetical protein